MSDQWDAHDPPPRAGSAMGDHRSTHSEHGVRAPRDDATSEAPAMEEGDGGQDGVWSRAGEEEPGQAIQNVIFLCSVFFSFAWRNWREGDRGAPALTTGTCASVRRNVVGGRDLVRVLKAENPSSYHSPAGLDAAG